MIYAAKDGKDTKVACHDMLFTLSDVRARIVEVWDNWCRLEEDYRPIIHYYLGDLTQRSPYPFHRILNLSRAVEVYHRKAVKGTGHLDERMRCLWERQSSRMQELLGKKDTLAKQVLNARHYYTHYNRDYSEDAGSEAVLAIRLGILLTSIILQELGFSNDEIDQMAASCKGADTFQIVTFVAYHTTTC